MMVRCLMLAALLLPLAARAETPQPFQVGQTVRMIHPPTPRNWRGAKTEALITLIWYPTEPGQLARPHEIGPPGQPVFRGHPLVPGASVAAGQHPLILLSHGTGGTADSLDWLASALVEHGYLVVGVDHPGNNAAEPLTAVGFRLWWERARDLSDALDGVMADTELGPAIDPGRIGAAGFSLGGYTVLELAGARTDRDAFDRFCRSAAADAICRPPEAAALGSAPSGLALDETDPATKSSLERSGASFRDARVRAVFAIAPALGQAFDAAGLAGIEVPVAIVAGDSDLTVPVATNARHFAALIPHATIDILPDRVSHYTFLAPCIPAAMDRQAAICRDAPGVDRDAVHRQVATKATRFFAEALGGDGQQAPQ